MKGIPTKYKGVQFRSRLEAKWAAFFDLLHWQWDYEPFDLDGWIPDFLIRGVTPLLIEVKPTVDFVPAVGREMAQAKNDYNLMLCGLGPFTDEGFPRCSSFTHLGWSHHRQLDQWHEASVLENRPMRIWDMCFHTAPAFGEPFPGIISGINFDYLQEEVWWHDLYKRLHAMWAEAGNRVQWKAPR